MRDDNRVEPSNWHVDFTLRTEHIALLRRAYVSWQYCETGAPAIDPKRPYGNSYVEADIAEIIGETIPDEYDELAYQNWENERQPELMRLHDQTDIGNAMHVPNSSWIDSISYLRAGDEGSTFLAIFLETSPPSALLYAGVPSWIPGLLMAGIRNGDGKRSIGKAYNKLVKGKYEYERVEGEEKVRELRRLTKRTNNRQKGRQDT